MEVVLNVWPHASKVKGRDGFRRVSNSGSLVGPRVSEKLVWWIVRERDHLATIKRIALWVMSPNQRST